MNQETPNGEAGRLLTCSALLAYSPTFKHVLDFAFRMESKLAKNRHKGDRDGWLKDHPWNLVERILDETVEVQECFVRGGEHGNDVALCKTPEQTADECADTANFCMMVADRVTYSPNGRAETTILNLPSEPETNRRFAPASCCAVALVAHASVKVDLESLNALGTDRRNAVLDGINKVLKASPPQHNLPR